MVTRQRPGRCPGLAGTVKGHDHMNPENSAKLSILHRKSFSVQFMSNRHQAARQGERPCGDVRGKYYSAFWNQCSEQMSIGGGREIAAICARRLCHLVGGPGRTVLRPARPARRDVGPDWPERGERHRCGRDDQPPVPHAAMAAACCRADQPHRRSGQLPAGPGHRNPPLVPVLRGRAVPADLSAVCLRAAHLHQVAHARPGPAQPHRRADADRGTGPAVMDLPDPALRAQFAAFLAAEERRHRLPARRLARAGPAGPAARAGGGADQDHGVPDPGRPRGTDLGRRLRPDPGARDVSQRHRGRSRLGRVLRRVGRRGAASHDDRTHQAGAPAAGLRSRGSG